MPQSHGCSSISDAEADVGIEMAANRPTQPISSLEGSTDIDSWDEQPEETKYGSGFWANIASLLDNKLIRGFHPSIFINVMATGISSSILYNFPYPGHWMRVLSYIMWGIGIMFFFSGIAFMVIACWKHPQKFLQIHTDPKIAPFMGCFAMGYTSMLNMLWLVTRKSWIIGIFVLFWIAVFLSLYTAYLIFYLTFLGRLKHRKGEFHPSNFHTTMLLPIVALTVTSSTGQMISPDMPTLNLQLVTMVVSFVLWANAIVLSFLVLSLCYWKYFVHKVPSTAMVFTTFIPIGFLGQGAYSILLFAHNMFELIMKHHTSLVHNNSHLQMFAEYYDRMDSNTVAVIMGTIIVYICTFFALILISFGYFCTLIAVTTVLSKLGFFTKNYDRTLCYSSKRDWTGWFNGLLKYHKGFWAMTFPLGTMAVSNTELHKLFSGLGAFRVIGAIYGATTVVVTTGCCIGFLYHVVRDVAKCIKTN